MSAVRLYWQTRAPTSGAPASAGKRRAAYSRASRSFAASREPLERVRVDLVAGRVGRDLHPEPAELAVAVVAAPS